MWTLSCAGRAKAGKVANGENVKSRSVDGQPPGGGNNMAEVEQCQGAQRVEDDGLQVEV